MEDFETLKERARQLFKLCRTETEHSERALLATRHAADQAQGGRSMIEEMLTIASEADLPAVRNAYADAVKSCDEAERSYERALESHSAAVSSREKFRVDFMETFGEEP